MKLDHINIRTNNIEAVRQAFENLLLLEIGARPAFSSSGYWLYGNGHPIVHLNAIDTDPGSISGAVDHVAFKDDDYDGLLSRLNARQVEYTLKTVPGSGVRQVFFNITHGITIEVDFDPVP